MLALHEFPVETPAFLYDENRILDMAKLLAQARQNSGCRVLYSIKALPFKPVLELLAPWVDGYSVSSLFEARLAASLSPSLHITTPGLQTADIAEISSLCRYVAFNSLEQFRRLHSLLATRCSPGLRINPGLSFLDDRRFDPCGESSKLGVPLIELSQALTDDKFLGERIKGLHFHTVFSSRSFEPLQETAALIEHVLGSALLSRLDWINLGGGYLFESLDDLSGLMQVAIDLRLRYGTEVYFEPGKAVVGGAGYLVATVIDCFRRDSKMVAVLDTTVNHNPETFEYQIRPEPAWTEPERGESAILVGCTCLAGDIFGEYRLDRLPAVGDRLGFSNLGAYSLVKANRFNGYNLPFVYTVDAAKNLRRVKSYGFEEYHAQWTADGNGPGGL